MSIVQDHFAMSSPPKTPAQWSDLAAETKEAVLKNLSLDDLKTCRTVDRQTGEVATGILFRLSCLGPGAASLARAGYLSTHTRFSKMIRCLEIHRYGLRRLPHLDKFFDACPELANVDRTSVPDELAQKISARYNDFREEIRSERGFARDRSQIPLSLTDALEALITGFPRLDRVIYSDGFTQNTFGLYEPGVDRGYYRNIGASELDPRKCMITWQLLTQILASTRLTALELRSLHWRALAPASGHDTTFACFQTFASSYDHIQQFGP